MTAATRSGRTRRAPAPDRLCAEAVALAREAVEAAAGPGQVGDHIEAVADGDRVVTHFFECLESAYRGWRWAATLTRASRAKAVTLDETVLLPGPDALLAPEWVPWSERLRPGDLGPGDLLPTEADDLRLEPGGVRAAAAAGVGSGAGAGSGAAVEVPAATEETEEVAEEVGADLEPGSPSEVVPPPARGTIAEVAEELGMGRPRVLSRYGLDVAADRWDEEYGAATPMAQSAPASCVTCGFLMPLAGSLRQAFGVCANEYSPADGHVVSLSYGCGGHSEAAVMPKPPQPPPPVIDETRADELS
ncbi:hypothetical protein DB35_24240 [Streptomyces abyssalis]|uniref:DUF3027 domain-containing protein n=1 Tax=Streptomyces abyssalis TaxID=933944 RepID=A0A1E7JNN1_9ACTN|nr:DUF3027 domain-containing protein [Streptomyces abyssalis]OEU86757.1 hypothetical protein DB35_24240 [Streptomyces abyssalis]OEU89854.1 hypothetical protein AN215_09300 [Streptomyces abyssalis]OEV30310.1 hypothetical protein AN219_11635 [Streptomyces nanshensis]